MFLYCTKKCCLPRRKNQICKYEATAKVKRTFPNSITATYLRLPKLESHKYSLKMNNRNQKKVKRKTITLETKIAILNRLADGEGSTALGKEYKLGESIIRAIQKRASRINESKNSATNESGKRISYSRNILIEKTDCI
uniref:HTH psq-type domain-containing protein n=1 Tax=Glossina palpalis gambiensis TaxID=67801 RepID=A0A1B0BKE4_9MUSC